MAVRQHEALPQDARAPLVGVGGAPGVRSAKSGAHDRDGGNVAGSTVLVTGATGSIGSALVALLVASGCQVVGWDLHVEDGVTAPLKTVTYRQVDHTERSSVAAAAAALPPVDHIALLAGRALGEESQADSAGDLPGPDSFAKSVGINLVGHYEVIHAVLPVLRSPGSITLASSINAVQGFGLPAYTSAKAGMHGLVCALAQPLGRRGVRINAVDIGTVRTAASEVEWAHQPQHFELLSRGTALGRLTTDVEVARTFSSVMHELTAMTGSVITVDSGQATFRARG